MILHSSGSMPRRAIVLAGCLMLLGCNLARVTGDATWTPPASTPRPAEAEGWKTLAPGMERRDMTVQTGALKTEAVVIRLDPSVVVLRVHYRPGDPQLLDEWQAQLPDADLIVNGAFFDETDHALGLIINDGTAMGQTLSGFGGMLQVDTAGGTRVRSLVGEPYGGEGLQQAVQGFPMLIEAGGVMAPQGDGFDERSRRTAVGQDRTGRILFISIPYGFVSLAELQDWLMSSGLDLNIAFGLDGGRSTGMLIHVPGNEEAFPAMDTLPSVVAAYAP